MNKGCPRPLYTERIRLFIGSSVAKVLIGVRGSGKSSVLKTIQQETSSGAVFFDMGARSNVKFRDPDALYGEIKKRLGDGKEMCLIIDEVQMIHDWEDMIRSLIDEKCCDIYISGSDSKLFSSDTSTYLAGRTVSADVFTLTYSECIEFQRFYGRNEDPDYVMDRFLRVGGFPIIWSEDLDGSSACCILSGIESEAILRDIQQRYGFRSTELLDRILDYICDNLGRPMSVFGIFNSLRSEDPDTSKNEVYAGIDHLLEACIICRAETYDVRRKKVLRSGTKYYLSDIGLKSLLRGYREDDISGVMENIIYLELRSRGYRVWVGDAKGKEIDFIAEKMRKKVYIQATFEMSSPDTAKREYSPLREIDDNFPKYVVVMKENPFFGDSDGIRCVLLKDFLLSKDY